MEFFEQVKQTAADVAHKVGKKSGEVVEISKIRYAIFDLKGDINKLYTEIGKMVYASMDEDELPDEIKMKCEIVAAKLAKIEALQSKEKNVKAKAVCPNCGRTCNAAAEVCDYCGEAMSVPVDADVMDTEASEEF